MKNRLSLYHEPRYSSWHNYVTQVSQTTVLGLEPQPSHALPCAIFRRLRVLFWLHHPSSVGILLNINAETASRAPYSPHIHPEIDCGIYILSFYCKESFYFSHLKSSNVWQMKVQDWLKIYVSRLCSYWQYPLLVVEILTWSYLLTWAKNMVCSQFTVSSPHLPTYKWPTANQGAKNHKCYAFSVPGTVTPSGPFWELTETEASAGKMSLI